ncbi:MAG TPA: TIGR03862 family flavoprotein [Patescibacteria group bacterium]|nr:TIGR03862 family flavoprotein [Patescibacteria group bacterium]
MKTVAVIGGGPAGLIAAEVLAQGGATVLVYDRKPSLARKFLMAGRGGLNLTHSEDLDTFIARYGAAAPRLAPYIRDFPPQALRDWSAALGEETFVGSSGRVFPQSFKASPLLRAWQSRLIALGVRFRLQHDWRGFADDGALVFAKNNETPETVTADATLLALGGASWPRLGADGGWVGYLPEIKTNPFQPSNCGFTVAWSDIFRNKFAGQPLKPVTLRFGGQQIAGEAMLTATGIEGGATYALSAALREAIAASGSAELIIDLKPGVTEPALAERLQAPRRGRTLANFLRQEINLAPPAIGLMQEDRQVNHFAPAALAQRIKSCSVTLTGIAGIERAISSAGGIDWEELDDNLMLRRKPGVFAAGEMIDWEAPTGGYLLQACFATGVAAAKGILLFLNNK